MARATAKTLLVLAPERASQRYLSIDARTLGAARIYIGGLLLAELAQRATSWFALFADDGIFGRANQGSPAARASFFWYFGTHTQLAILFAAIALVYLALFLGFWTRLANVLAFLAWTGMSRRLPITVNAGYVVMSLLLLWTSLLPMGRRFSVDALRASLARHPESRVADLAARDAMTAGERAPVSSLAVLAVILQVSAIYFFNAAMKYGEAWRDLTAVHYVLHDNEFTTPLAGLVRDHISTSVYKALAAMTLVVEYGIAVSVLLPFAWTRRIAYASIVTLHLGFGVLMLLGPFSWSCCGLAMLLVPPEDWAIAGKTLRRVHRARTVLIDESDARARRFARLLARLDGFGLLRFEAAERSAPISVRGADARVVSGRAAIAACIAALPLGPIVSRLFVSPLGDVTPAIAAGIVGLFDRFPPSKILERPGITGVALTLNEVATAALIVIAIAQGLSDVDLLRRRYNYERPAFVVAFAKAFGMVQAWQLFAPAPTQRTRFTVVDAETQDGRHIDPFTGRPPLTRFDVPLACYGLPQFWVDYLRKQFESNAYYAPMREYVLRYPERTGRPEDRIVRAHAYLLVQNDPPFGETEPLPAVQHLMWTTWETGVYEPHPEDQPGPRRPPPK